MISYVPQTNCNWFPNPSSELPDEPPPDVFGDLDLQRRIGELTAQHLNKRVKALVAHLAREPTKPTHAKKPPAATAKGPHPFKLGSAKPAEASRSSGSVSSMSAANPKVVQESDENTSQKRPAGSSSAPTEAAVVRNWWSKPKRTEPEPAQPKASAGPAPVVGVQIDPIEDVCDVSPADVHDADGSMARSTDEVGVRSMPVSMYSPAKRHKAESPAKPGKAETSPAASKVPNRLLAWRTNMLCSGVNRAACCAAGTVPAAHQAIRSASHTSGNNCEPSAEDAAEAELLNSA